MSLQVCQFNTFVTVVIKAGAQQQGSRGRRQSKLTNTAVEQTGIKFIFICLYICHYSTNGFVYFIQTIS